MLGLFVVAALQVSAIPPKSVGPLAAQPFGTPGGKTLRLTIAQRLAIVRRRAPSALPANFAAPPAPKTIVLKVNSAPFPDDAQLGLQGVQSVNIGFDGAVMQRSDESRIRIKLPKTPGMYLIDCSLNYNADNPFIWYRRTESGQFVPTMQSSDTGHLVFVAKATGSEFSRMLSIELDLSKYVNSSWNFHGCELTAIG